MPRDFRPMSNQCGRLRIAFDVGFAERLCVRVANLRSRLAQVPH